MATANGFFIICVSAILFMNLKINTSAADGNCGDISKVLKLNSVNENVYMKFAQKILGQYQGSASNRSNERLIDSSDEAKYIEIINFAYEYYRIGSFVILRIIFGVISEVANVKAALERPIGIGIAIFCNFMFIPLVSLHFKTINSFLINK